MSERTLLWVAIESLADHAGGCIPVKKSLPLPMTIRTAMVVELNRRNEADEDWWVGECAKVAEGMPLYKIAKHIRVTPSVYRVWIACDNGREEAYQRALKLQEELRKDRARAEVFDISTRRVKNVNGAEKLRAAEMLLSPKPGVSITNENGGKMVIIHESQ